MLVLWYGLVRHGNHLLFYLLFAVAVTASVQLVGVYLVFASLIIPALAVRNAGKYALWIAYGLGAAGYGLGVLLIGRPSLGKTLVIFIGKDDRTGLSTITAGRTFGLIQVTWGFLNGYPEMAR